MGNPFIFQPELCSTNRVIVSSKTKKSSAEGGAAPDTAKVKVSQKH